MSSNHEDIKREQIAEAGNGRAHGEPFHRRPAFKILILVVLFSAIGIWAAGFFTDKIMPSILSTQMKSAHDTIILFTVLAAPVAALVYAIAAYSVYKWGHGHGDEPPPDGPPMRENSLATGLWLGVSAILVVVLLVWGMTALSSENQGQLRPVTVDVYGQQWLWTFKYPGTGVESNQLVVPAGRQIRFVVTSYDVTHGFWPNSLGVQIDANPGFKTYITADPNKTGPFAVRCSQLCGLYHAYMDATGKVVTAAQFSSWLVSQGASSTSANAYALGGN